MMVLVVVVVASMDFAFCSVSESSPQHVTTGRNERFLLGDWQILVRGGVRFSAGTWKWFLSDNRTKIFVSVPISDLV